MSRSKLLPLFLFAVAVLVSNVVCPAAAEEPVAGCGLDLSVALKAPISTLAQPALPAAPELAPVVPAPEFLAAFHGYCRCSCSRVKNCNTSADCGGSACMGAISCC